MHRDKRNIPLVIAAALLCAAVIIVLVVFLQGRRLPIDDPSLPTLPVGNTPVAR